MGVWPAAQRATGRLAANPALARRTRGQVKRAGRLIPAVIIALAAVLTLWSRLVPLSHGLWNDEAYSALVYIRPGPSGIFGQYIPNDHILFELLAWATTNLIGDFSEAAMRFWSVAPALAAGVLMTWWLWRRLDPWVAAIFAVLAAAAPLYWELSVQARGYGLGYLAATVMLISVDALMWRPRRRYLLLFAVSATVGIWTLPVFVLSFLPLAALLASRKSLRRYAIGIVIGVGVLSFLFYLPVLSGVISSSSQHFGTQLPWYGAISGPLKDQVIPSVDQLLPGISERTAEIIGGVVIALGVLVLWRRPERRLALALIGPTLFCYLFLELGRLYEADRFVSFLGLSLIALAAVALVKAGRLLTASRAGRIIAVACGIAFSLYALEQAEKALRGPVETPIENFKEAAQLVQASGIAKVVSNSTKAIGFDYYFGIGRVEFETPAELQSLFCSTAVPFVYLEHGLSPLADTKCLTERGAVPIEVPQTRSTLAVWFVTSLRSGQHGTAPTAVAPSTDITCPTVLAGPSSARLATEAVGQSFTVNLNHAAPPVNATVRLTVTGTRLVSSVAGEFTARGSTFHALGRFLVIRYRITNLGPATVEAEELVNSRFVIAGDPGGSILPAPAFDASCALVATSYAVRHQELSAYTHIASGQTVDTAAAYPLPSAIATPAAVAQRLTWSAPVFGVSSRLPRPGS